MHVIYKWKTIEFQTSKNCWVTAGYKERQKIMHHDHMIDIDRCMDGCRSFMLGENINVRSKNSKLTPATTILTASFHIYLGLFSLADSPRRSSRQRLHWCFVAFAIDLLSFSIAIGCVKCVDIWLNHSWVFCLLTVSIVVFIIITILVISEIRYYTTSQFAFDYDVDPDFQG